MDMDTLWFLLLIAFFVLRALGGSRSKEKTRERARRPADESTGDTSGGLSFSFDDVLGEIREALEQASAQQRQAAEAGEAAPTLEAPDTGPEPPSSGWSELPPMAGGHRRHGTDDAYHDEEAFEEEPLDLARPVGTLTDEEVFTYDAQGDFTFHSMEKAAGSTAPVTEGSIVGADSTVRRTEKQSTPAASSVLDQLRTREEARRAVLLSEVLGPPRSKRPFGR